MINIRNNLCGAYADEISATVLQFHGYRRWEKSKQYGTLKTLNSDGHILSCIMYLREFFNHSCPERQTQLHHYL